MSDSKQRYTNLAPLTTEEMSLFAVAALNFFAPLSYRDNCKLLNIDADEKSIRPMSFGNLLNYLKIKHPTIDSHKYMKHIEVLINRLVSHAYLTYTGSVSTGSPPFCNTYYSILELSKQQKENLFWLGSALGTRFLRDKYAPYIVRFEGKKDGTGSGILISEEIVLTCGHNIKDLSDFTCWIEEKQLHIEKPSYHKNHDIGIVKLSEKVPLSHFPYFGKPYELDKVITMGYPPLKGMGEAPLIVQSGEINAISIDWQRCDCITISSITRPGNSGGPVISKSGYIVGIVTQSANDALSASCDQKVEDTSKIPFFNAVSSTSIVTIVKEIDDTICLPFEDYQ